MALPPTMGPKRVSFTNITQCRTIDASFDAPLAIPVKSSTPPASILKRPVAKPETRFTLAVRQLIARVGQQPVLTKEQVVLFDQLFAETPAFVRANQHEIIQRDVNGLLSLLQRLPYDDPQQAAKRCGIIADLYGSYLLSLVLTLPETDNHPLRISIQAAEMGWKCIRGYACRLPANDPLHRRIMTMPRADIRWGDGFFGSSVDMRRSWS